jgi:hypothetical protein
LRVVVRGGAASRDVASFGEELGTWLTSSSASISLFVRHVKYFRSIFASLSANETLPPIPLAPPRPALLKYSRDFRMRLDHPSLGRTLCLNTFLLAVTLASAQTQSQTPPQKPALKPTSKSAAPPATEPPIASPVSRHYPILIVAHGNNPVWSLRLGMKGPERLDRSGYPPIILDPGEVTLEAPGVSWTYHAKDDTTGADISIQLTRAPCLDNPTDAASPKFTFTIALQHAQIGPLSGCGQSAPDKFPEFRKKNQNLEVDNDSAAKDKDKNKDSKDKDGKDKDKDKDNDKLAVLEPITKFQSPTAVAYLDASGHVLFARAGVRKTVANEGSELAVSHDGKKLLYARSDSATGPQRTIVLYDSDTGRSRDLVSGNARSAFWSPDDSRVAFLKYEADSKTWQLWTLSTAAPESAALFAPQPLDALHGWVTPTTLLASDLQNAYWLSDDKPPQSVPLKEIYGDAYEVTSSDALRPNPLNPDLLLVTAYYAKAPAGAPTDSVGLNSTFFLYELRSHRRAALCPADSYARAAEWSRDGLQIFFTRGIPGKATLSTWRLFWDTTGLRSYSLGSFLSIGR